MEKNKKTIVQAIICVGLLCVIWGGYWLIKHYWTDRIVEIKENNYEWICQVESVETEGMLQIQGFAFVPLIDAKAKTYEIILCDINTKKIYFPKMRYEERMDVNQFFLGEYDYSQSGFVATIKNEKINLDENTYEILIRTKGERKAFRMGVYIENGEILYANPNECEELDVVGTELEAIIKDGILRVNRPDHGMYVYQYGNVLYWIAEDERDFIEGDIILQYFIEPIDISKVPNGRLDKWGWENIGFKFSEYEVKEWNTGKYRVARREIPVDYQINRIVTGNYMNGEIWRADFYPYYQIIK